MNKGNIDVFKVRYILNKQKKNLERNEMIDVDQATENLTAVKAFFYQVGLYDQGKTAAKVLSMLSKANNDNRKFLASVTKMLVGIRHLTHKRRIMDQMRCRAEIAYNKRQKQNVEVKQYDVVMAPTQGGWHHSIVASVEGNTIICYPVTTANKFQLRKNGCKSAKISHCNIDSLNGYRITSAAVRLDRDKVQVLGHLEKTAMIENTIMKYNKERLSS